MSTASKDPESLLPRFGLESFRKGQRNVIDAILKGRDTLCIMPTGGGKSLCYQLPALARDGVTIVISPLIALMKDQVDSLAARNIPATMINSTLSPDEQHRRIDAMVRGEYKLIYIAPERLRSSSFMKAVGRTTVSMLAIDEAHCISQWGHDFRPDYARLGRLRERLGNPQTVALTATATGLVQRDIVAVLQLENPATFISGFARENLFLGVEAPGSNSEKDRMLVDFLNRRDGCGIVYAATRKNCEHIVDLLGKEIRRKVAFYHAGLPTEKRRKVQESFMSGETPVIVATNAFGMGIDKSDLRFVVHYNIPGSIEAYYQEAGRAGRDGKPSECLLLFSYQDRFIQEFFVENSYPSKEVVKEIYEYLRTNKSDPIEMTLQEIKDELDLQIGTGGIANCENLLERAGAIERLDSRQNMAAIRIDSELTTLIDLLPRDARVQRHVMRGLEKVVGPLRGERVMFVPEKFAQRLEMKWNLVNRHIRELTRLDAVDYVPPFRGRAIHMLNRRKKFRQLNIDFDELERRKQSELKKLQSVITLCTTKRCRQLEILEYFGDPDRHHCRNCDCCRRKQADRGAPPKNANVDACMYAAQVALSGVARTHGRYGRTIVAQMLTGSTAKKVEKFGLSRLSTFGLLKGLKQAGANALLEWLVDEGYAEQTETTRYRPQIRITSRGLELVGGRLRPDLLLEMPGSLITSLSRAFKGKVPHAVAEEEDVEPLETDLPAEDDPETVNGQSDTGDLNHPELNHPDLNRPDLNRPEWNGLETAEMIDGDDFPDRALSSGDADPDSPPDDAGRDHSGHNDSELIEQSPAFADPEPSPTESVGTRDSKEEVVAAWYWTWKLLVDGYNPQQIGAIRGLEPELFLDHLNCAATAGYEVPMESLFSESKIEELETVVTGGEGKRLTTLISELSPDTDLSPAQLMLYLKCRSLPGK